MLSPQTSYARHDLFAHSRTLGIAASSPQELFELKTWTPLQCYSHDLLVSCSGRASVCVWIVLSRTRRLIRTIPE